MKQVKDLKQGDKICCIYSKTVEEYTYLCVHPKGRGAYHILLNSSQDPFKIHESSLQALLDQDLKNYSEGLLALADKLEEEVKYLKNESKRLSGM